MRQVQYEKAFQCFEECSLILPSFIANYYNAVCAASRMENAEWVGHWSGRMATAARFVAKLLDFRLDHFLDLRGLRFQVLLNRLYPGFHSIKVRRGSNTAGLRGGRLWLRAKRLFAWPVPQPWRLPQAVA